ncbi:sugar phosphate isomerase/epimerase family protein [Streptomyces jeddahensis]|uniref:Xylose isomerase-like TIM barrel n=1 Tax=Streptomyces jeddahensis TaxID=1716141 RepID=A0A177HUY8_9ACTN|nr:sugar phosphate isomerase/epimerase family protein [Streptomyces jeddahensis]OAH13948.1 xylose isomerase-like TIM barrel [Streptomyces jeddahensis]
MARNSSTPSTQGGAAMMIASHVTLTGAGFGEPPRHDFAARCAAAAAAGFDGVGLHAADPVFDDGDAVGLRRVRQALDSSGLRLMEIELLTGWTDGTAGTSAADGASVRRLLALAEAFCPHHVTAGTLDPGPVDAERASRALRELGDRFGEFGTRVAVEGFAWSGLGDPRTWREVVHGCASPWVGFMVDTWHFRNGDGTHDEALDLLGDRIAAVQLNDGRIVAGDHMRHAREERHLPGEGELRPGALAHALRARGYDGPWAVESCDAWLQTAPAKAAASAAFGALAAAIG